MSNALPAAALVAAGRGVAVENAESAATTSTQLYTAPSWAKGRAPNLGAMNMSMGTVILTKVPGRKGRAVRVFTLNRERLREAIEAVEALTEELRASLNSETKDA